MNKHIVTGAIALALAGGGAGAAVVAAQEAPPTVGVAITPKKMTLTGAEALKSGPTRLAFSFKGRGESGFVVMRLKPGVTRAQVSRAAPKIQNPGQATKYGDFVASSFLANGRKYATTLTLTPARYVIVDITKTAAVRAGFVVGPEASTAVAPQPATTIGLEDYAVDVPDVVPRTGAIRVENRGKVLHHLLAFPLRKGLDTKKLVRDIKAGKDPSKAFAGPPSAPVEVVSPGTVNDVETSRRPGKLLYICFLQDSRKAPPHAALGMVKVVTVK